MAGPIYLKTGKGITTSDLMYSDVLGVSGGIQIGTTSVGVSGTIRFNKDNGYQYYADNSWKTFISSGEVSLMSGHLHEEINCITNNIWIH